MLQWKYKWLKTVITKLQRNSINHSLLKKSFDRCNRGLNPFVKIVPNIICGLLYSNRFKNLSTKLRNITLFVEGVINFLNNLSTLVSFVFNKCLIPQRVLYLIWVILFKNFYFFRQKVICSLLIFSIFRKSDDILFSKYTPSCLFTNFNYWNCY